MTNKTVEQRQQEREESQRNERVISDMYYGSVIPHWRHETAPYYIIHTEKEAERLKRLEEVVPADDSNLSNWVEYLLYQRAFYMSLSDHNVAAEYGGLGSFYPMWETVIRQLDAYAKRNIKEKDNE